MVSAGALGDGATQTERQRHLRKDGNGDLRRAARTECQADRATNARKIAVAEPVLHQAIHTAGVVLLIPERQCRNSVT